MTTDGIEGTIYLLHFSRRFKHAGHYLGWTSDLDARLVRHQAGRGARLIQVVESAGIEVSLVRTWKGTRHDERRIKGRGKGDICPVCAALSGHTVRSPRLEELYRHLPIEQERAA